MARIITQESEQFDKVHAAFPERGDHWKNRDTDENVCVVIDVTDKYVTLCKTPKANAIVGWMWDWKDIKTITRCQFKDWLSTPQAKVHPKAHLHILEHFNIGAMPTHIEPQKVLIQSKESRRRGAVRGLILRYGHTLMTCENQLFSSYPITTSSPVNTMVEGFNAQHEQHTTKDEWKRFFIDEDGTYYYVRTKEGVPAPKGFDALRIDPATFRLNRNAPYLNTAKEYALVLLAIAACEVQA